MGNSGIDRFPARLRISSVGFDELEANEMWAARPSQVGGRACKLSHLRGYWVFGCLEITSGVNGTGFMKGKRY